MKERKLIITNRFILICICLFSFRASSDIALEASSNIMKQETHEQSLFNQIANAVEIIDKEVDKNHWGDSYENV